MTTKIINIYDFKAEFSKYAKEVLKGASLIVSMRNKPFAEFRPLNNDNPKPLKFGVLKNELSGFTIPADFNEPLLDFEADYYGHSK